MVLTCLTQVFLAIHNKTGQGRAVKRVRRDTQDADEALQKELEIMSRLLGSPHVVTVFDGYLDPTYRYMVCHMGCMQGR